MTGEAILRPGWYAILTVPRGEFAAAEEIAGMGRQAWAPWRRGIATRGRQQFKVRRPAFPRYVFGFLIQTDIAAINDVRWVHGVVRCGSDARPVPDAVMAALLSRRGPEDELDMADADLPVDSRIQPFDWVRFTTGALADTVAQVSDVEKDAIRVWLTMMGAPRKIRVPAGNVEILSPTDPKVPWRGRERARAKRD